MIVSNEEGIQALCLNTIFIKNNALRMIPCHLLFRYISEPEQVESQSEDENNRMEVSDEDEEEEDEEDLSDEEIERRRRMLRQKVLRQKMEQVRNIVLERFR